MKASEIDRKKLAVVNARDIRKHLVGDFELEEGKWRIVGWRDEGAHSDVFDIYGREGREETDSRTFAMKLSKSNVESLEAAKTEMNIYKTQMGSWGTTLPRFLAVYGMGVMEELYTSIHDKEKGHKSGLVSHMQEMTNIPRKDPSIIEHYKDLPFIVMEKVNLTLAKIRSMAPNREHGFPEGFALKLGLGCFHCITAFHQLGYIHRHITPRNFGIRLAKNYKFPKDVESGVVLFDFGLAKEWPGTEEPELCAPFVGSTRYSSINVHNMKEQGPVDDLWSLFYMVVEWCSEEEELPWTHHTTDIHKAANIKSSSTHSHLCRNFRARTELEEFAEILHSLSAWQRPPTERIEYLFMEAIRKNRTCTNPSWIPFSE